MNNKSSIIITIIMVTLAIATFSHTAYSQDGMTLINQLTGKTEAPSRSAEQLTQAYQEAIDYLMPLMTSSNARSQYEPQLALQNLGSY